MDSLTIFLKLIDRLVSLVREHDKNKRELFNEIVEPLFKDLEAVIDDYFMLFHNARLAIQHSPGNEWRSKIEDVLTKREQTWLARKKVIALAEVIEKEIKDKKIVLFTRRILRLFYVTEVGKSRSEGLVELLNILEDDFDKDFILQGLVQTESQLKNAWISIAQTYADLRLDSLK